MQITSRRHKERRIAALIATLLLSPVVVLAGVNWVPRIAARWSYSPADGDILFRSLPPSRLSRAIEGATHSRFSHCGIVERYNERWTVLEAYRGVERTPLSEWLSRGQGGGFVVYRLKPSYREHVPAMIAAAATHLGKPYDVRYRFDDEKIYCSELVFNAYQKVTGESLGRLIPLGELDWEPFTATIEHYEGGPPPLDREMITPRDLAKAEQLEEVFRFGL